ncbi:MAG: hypothetical protein ACK4ND_15770 [Cytophagaceae bacterium]
MKNSNKLGIFLLLALFSLAACIKEDIAPPIEENEVEEFTYIEFIFTNQNTPGDVVKGIWEDEDGFGPKEPVILQHPVLKTGQTYILTYVMENRLMNPVENVLEEIKDEEDEHQLFYAFDENVFASPVGIGNIHDRNGVINYLDFDENNLPIGLKTEWTTGAPVENAKFRAVLAHQPGVKSATSSYDSDDIDWDITFNLTIEE